MVRNGHFSKLNIPEAYSLTDNDKEKGSQIIAKDGKNREGEHN
jgi:hypothetical protein